MRRLIAQYQIPILVGLIAFAGTALATPSAPPLATPVPGPSAPADLLPEIHSLNGRGAAQASAVVSKAAELLPFEPLLPSVLPTGYELFLADLSVRSRSSASFQVVYVGGDLSRQLHVYEKAGPLFKEPLADILERDDVVIGADTWRYMLISFPQPSGEPLAYHVLERFDGSRFVSIDWRSHGELESEKAQLARIAASLR